MEIKEIMSAIIGSEGLELSFGGHLLLERPLLNKGTAFTREERCEFGLLGLVPPAEETLFAQEHAGVILDRYRERLCSFNDDIQGTGAVAAGTLLAAVAVSGSRLREQWVVILGAGSAGCGIAEQLVTFMVSEGPRQDVAAALPAHEAEAYRDRGWVG